MMVGGVLLLTVAAQASPGVQHSSPENVPEGEIIDPDERVPKCSIVDESPFSANTTIDLYADDVERDFADEAERDSWLEENCDGNTAFLELGTEYSPFARDRSYRSPPGLSTTQLNRHKFRNLSVETGIYPRDDYVGPIRIDHNQVRIFSIENGTKAHFGNGTVRTVIPEQGRINGFFHYNTTNRVFNTPPYRTVYLPPDNVTEYVVRSGSEDIYDHYTVEYQDSCVVVNGGNCSTGTVVSTGTAYENLNERPRPRTCANRYTSCNTSGKFGFNYDLSDVDNVSTLSFVVEVEQQFVEEIWQCEYSRYRRSWCYDENGSRRSHLWEKTGEDVYTRTTTMRHTIDDISVSNPNASMEVATFPDGHREARVETGEEIRKVTFGERGNQRNPDGVRYKWEYFSASTSFWDTVESQPVWIHAYPVRGAETTPAFVGPDIEEKSIGRTAGISRGSLPDNVVMDDLASQYSSVDEVVVSDISTYERSNVTAYGIPPGSEAEVDITTREIEETNLTITRVRSNKTHAEFQVRLVDSSGNPISTEDRPGTIYVNGQEYDTNSRGKVIVETRRLGPVRARYEPVEWYKLDSSYTAYAASEDKAYSGPGDDLLPLILYIIVRTSPLWVGILVISYLLDKLPDANTWPPWEVVK